MAKTSSAPIAPARVSDELDALHATLDSRLAALEAALADPNECALEVLILDLARAATEEAEANARRASARARADADKQAGSALSQLQVSEAALASERQAGLELHRSLGAARSELEAAKQKVTALTNELEHMRDAFASERTTLRSELSEAERCFAAADTRRQQVEEGRDEEVARERANVQRLTDALMQARGEIDAARQDVASRAADMEAARERADTAARANADLTQTLNDVRTRADAAARANADLTQTLNDARARADIDARANADLTQALNDARARADAVGQERDRLQTELEAARQNIEAARQNAVTSAAAIQSGTAERAAVEQKWHDAEARVAAVIRERDGLVGDRDAVVAQLEAARQGSATAAAAAQAIETQRAVAEQTLREVEARHQTLIHEHDAVAAERDAALSKRDALVAERDAAVARRDAAEAERSAALAQLDAARQGSSTASAAIQSLDAHRATLEQNWQNAEARSQALQLERDTAITQRDAAVAERAAAVASAEALRKAVGHAQETERARFSELRQRTERQIQDLETELLGGVSAAEEDGPEIDVALDDVDATEAIEIEPVVLAARPKAAAHVSSGAQNAPPAAQQPTRGASRQGFREPLEVKLDGETALLVDVSTAGAQVLSTTPLKPNKLVKMLLPSSEAIILCKAKIVWARFEPPTPGKPVRYRAGMVFTQADAAALQVFITRHSGVKSNGGTPAEERKTGRLIPVPFNTAASAGPRTRRAEAREPLASIDFNFPAQRRD